MVSMILITHGTHITVAHVMGSTAEIRLELLRDFGRMNSLSIDEARSDSAYDCSTTVEV